MSKSGSCPNCNYGGPNSSFPRHTCRNSCSRCGMIHRGASKMGVWKIGWFAVDFGRVGFEDLWEEVKKRTFMVVLAVVSLAYAMSLTSNSFLYNLPVSLILVIVLRRLCYEVDIFFRPSWHSVYGRPATKPVCGAEEEAPAAPLARTPPALEPMNAAAEFAVADAKWRADVNAPAVESAMSDLVACVVREWVSDLWYSHMTPDNDVPEEVALMIKCAAGEVAKRVRRVNLISLLTRDIVNLVTNHIEQYRRMKKSIGDDSVLESLPFEERDRQLRQALEAANELHIAVVSPETEYKVLRRLMAGVVGIALRPEDGQCPALRALARELLAMAVMRPIMHLLSPSFINEMLISAAFPASAVPPSESFPSPGPSTSTPTTPEPMPSPPLPKLSEVLAVPSIVGHHSSDSNVGIELEVLEPAVPAPVVTQASETGGNPSGQVAAPGGLSGVSTRVSEDGSEAGGVTTGSQAKPGDVGRAATAEGLRGGGGARSRKGTTGSARVFNTLKPGP